MHGGASAAMLLLAASAYGKSTGMSAATPACHPTGLWLTLPPTPSLPRAATTGNVRAGDAQLFYADFGKPRGAAELSAAPIMLLHGGMANSNYWGKVVPALSESHRVIVMDTRGHGRSTLGSSGLHYARLAEDVIAVLDRLNVPRAQIVGWSDGGVTGLSLGMNSRDRIAGLFLFGANCDASGLIRDGSRSFTYRAYERRCAAEYLALSPEPDFPRLRAALLEMWMTQPRYTKSDLGSISAPTTVADGEHEEIISRTHFDKLAALIPGSRRIVQPCVSHFAILQDPAGFIKLVQQSLVPI